MNTETTGNKKLRKTKLYPILFLAGILVIGVSYSFWLQHGQSGIIRTSLEVKGILKFFTHQNWLDLPFEISKEEEELVNRINMISSQTLSIKNNVSIFLNKKTESELLEILEQHPNHFHTEFILGTWYQESGKQELADKFFTLSLKHAPVVLIQKYLLPDGKPATGLEIANFGIECNRVKNGSINPDLNLKFCLLETDKKGQVYLPVYDTVFRRSSYSWPIGHEIKSTSLGWFKARCKYSEMPVFKAIPKNN